MQEKSPVRLQSILDNDFYKFTMQQGVIKLFPSARVKYQFINRGKHSFPEGFAAALKQAVESMSLLRLTADEKDFLATNCPYLDATYLDFLQGFCFNPDEATIKQEAGDLQVSIEGLWYRTILWEVPLMSLISELYYQLNNIPRKDDAEVEAITREKIRKYEELGVTIAEFGTRRRHSYKVHQLVVKALKQSGSKSFVGTSNVHLAMINQTKPIGTHAHEWFMFHAAKYGFKMATLMGLESWVNVYRGDLGIALSDTYTSKVFFKQFDKMLSKLFDGVRHDSGDPLDFAEQTISHYKRMGIDPLSKTITFSDSLDYGKVKRIADHYQGKIGISFGIGTNFTNDAGPDPLNIVIKMTEACPDEKQWVPVVKLSDENGKYTGEKKAIALAKEVLFLTSTKTR